MNDTVERMRALADGHALDDPLSVPARDIIDMFCQISQLEIDCQLLLSALSRLARHCRDIRGPGQEVTNAELNAEARLLVHMPEFFHQQTGPESTSQGVPPLALKSNLVLGFTPPAVLRQSDDVV